MPKIAIIFGALLTALGVVTYVVSGSHSVTAMIPAFFGLPILLLGLAAARMEGMRKHLMHAAAALGLLGFLMSAGRLAMKGIGGAPMAVGSQIGMAVLCLVFVALCVNSFVQARRNRAVG